MAQNFGLHMEQKRRTEPRVSTFLANRFAAVCDVAVASRSAVASDLEAAVLQLHSPSPRANGRGRTRIRVRPADAVGG